MSMTDEEKQETHKKFHEAVNMTPHEIETFLKTPESKKVGQTKEGEDESIGHKSGKHIIAILVKSKAKLTDDDYSHMKKVISYVARHKAQGGPDHDKEHSNWYYSLKNWGYDYKK